MEIIARYFSGLTPGQLDQFGKLYDLYLFWNNKINVISRKDIGNLYIHHVLHSLAIAKVIRFVPGTTIMDVGTGGGFPGVPLAIFFPEAKFYLIDSIAKKIKVVNGIISELKLTNVLVGHKRVETVKEKFDFVVSRAVTSLPKFIPWVKNNIKSENKNRLNNGILYLKGGERSEELKDIKFITKVYPLENYFNEDFFKTKVLIHIQLDKD